MPHTRRTNAALAAILLAAVIATPNLVAAQEQRPQDSEREQRAALQEMQRLNGQTITLYGQGRYAEAIPLAERAYEIARAALNENHPYTLGSANNLAELYQSQGRYGEAEPLFEDTLRRSRATLGENHPDTLTSAHNLAALYGSQGRYGEAEPLYLNTLRRRGATLGEDHPNTLISANNLAGLYRAQGRYGEAEPLHLDTLRRTRAALGEDHSDTLNSANNLAGLYQAQGRYGEAEPLFEDTLRRRRAALGEDHPDTLTSAHNLAGLYEAQGRYGEAEPLYLNTLRRRGATLGEDHPSTLNSANNLAGLYQAQRRYGKAEPLYLETLRRSRAVLGEDHPSTLNSTNNLAGLYQAQGRYGEAEPLYLNTLRRRRATLGEDHPDTLISANNLAGLYVSHGRYGEAEPLYLETLRQIRAALGEDHPDTLRSANNLAFLYEAQGRYGETEPLYLETLRRRRAALGEDHPSTLNSANNLAVLYGAQGRYGAAEKVVSAALLARRGRAMREMQTAAGGQTRALAAQEGVSTQTFALSLAAAAHASGAADLSQLAAETMLWMKGVAGEYDAALNRAVALNPEAADEAVELRRLWALFAAQEQRGEIAAARATRTAIDATENALEARFPDLAATLEAPQWRAVVEALSDDEAPPNTALVEYMLYRPFDLETGEPAETRHLAAVVLRSGQPPRFEPLGALDDALAADLETLRSLDRLSVSHRALMGAGRRLHDRLIDPLAEALAGAETLFIAPDDALHQLPFTLLRGPDGRLLLDAFDLRLIPTGRVLVQPDGLQRPERHDGRFVAMGGAAYDLPPPEVAIELAQTLATQAMAFGRAFRGRGGDWGELPGAAAEIGELTEMFEEAPGFDAARPLIGPAATEAALRRLSDAPMVLHLATHGGSVIPDGDAPSTVGGSLLSQMALAFTGANLAMRGKLSDAENDGLVLGSDIARLALHGTRLVTLSACQSGIGPTREGEGVMSLAHAFRLAGAEAALMTYWPIDDAGTQRFMADFYRTWLEALAADPNAPALPALRAVQAKWRAQGEHPRHWAAFALIQN